MKQATQEQFDKMTKKEMLAMEIEITEYKTEITEAVFVLIDEKWEGWGTGAIFVKTMDGLWIKHQVYDCWDIRNDYNSPVTLSRLSSVLRGDFQHHGVRIFEFPTDINQKVVAHISYGGTITLSNKLKI